MLVLDVVVWHGKCLCHVKKYLSEALTECETQAIVVGVAVVRAFVIQGWRVNPQSDLLRK
jgi:hypothetical protein